MNLGYPYYWYGVDALSENDVVISGFDNSNWRGLLRGATTVARRGARTSC